MQFDNSFSVQAPIDEVFAAVADLERLVPCVPGATVLERSGEDVYEVTLKAQLGPLWKNFAGTITILEREPDEHRLVMSNCARDASGTHVGDATIQIGLAQLGDHTNVSINTCVTIIDGALAEKTMTQAAAKQMTDFTASLQTMIAATPQP